MHHGWGCIGTLQNAPRASRTSFVKGRDLQSPAGSYLPRLSYHSNTTMSRHRVLCTALPLAAVALLSACDSTNAVLPLAEVRDFTVVSVQGDCEGPTPVIAADLAVRGYEDRDVLRQNTTVGNGPAVLNGSDRLVIVNLSVDNEATPDDQIHEVRVTTRLDRVGITAGETLTLDVRTDAESGEAEDLYRPVRVAFPTCS